MKLNRIFALLMCCALVSCNTSKKIVYMNDAKHDAIDTIAVYHGIEIQPRDMLSIVVSSNKNHELAVPFNLPMMSFQAGNTFSAMSNSSRLLGYLVDMDGNIDFPVFGKLKVSGLTRNELSDMITEKIRDGQVKDAIVTVDFMNLKISVLGEVRNPGTFNLGDDRITILEALGRAGDLTIYGRRDNVLVRREQNGVLLSYRVDLRSSEALIHSPAYYLQQNDLVYVEPTARSRMNENRTINTGISILSLLTNIVFYLLLK